MPSEFQVLKFRKPLINDLSFVHPDTGISFQADRERMEHWIETFDLMKSRGLRVPFRKDHNFYAGEPENILGYLDKLSINDNGWLEGEFEIRGADSIKLAQTVDQVSVGVVIEELSDGLGNTYSDVLQHVALTGVPVVPGQTGFRIAASHDGQRFLVLSEKGEASMLNKEELTRLSEVLGEELTTDNAIDKIESKLKASSQTSDEAKQLTASRARVKELENLTIPIIDKATIEERSQFYGEMFDSLAPMQLSMSGVERLKDLLIGSEDSRNCYAMSVGSGKNSALIKEVYDILKNEAPRMELGQKTGPQSGTVALDSHGRDNDNGFDKNVHNRMRQFAGLGEL